MFSTVLYSHLYDNLTHTGGFVYGSAEAINPPYIIMRKITDPEQPVIFCETQGNAGKAMFQFSGYTGGGSAANALSNEQYLEAFKAQVKNIRGTIGTTEKYLIDVNITTGVRLLSDGLNELNVWGAMFETTFHWKKV
jgi:hypothetical protein